MTVAEQIRYNALDLAIRNGNSSDTPETTVDRAEKYFQFMTKES